MAHGSSYGIYRVPRDKRWCPSAHTMGMWNSRKEGCMYILQMSHAQFFLCSIHFSNSVVYLVYSSYITISYIHRPHGEEGFTNLCSNFQLTFLPIPRNVSSFFKVASLHHVLNSTFLTLIVVSFHKNRHFYPAHIPSQCESDGNCPRKSIRPSQRRLEAAYIGQPGTWR